MRILVTNDDGVHAPGIWHVVRALTSIDDVEVVVCAPDREQSGVGTSVTLHHPIKVSEVTPYVPGVKTYAVEGTPSDAVIVGLESLVTDKVDLVVSGINQGANLGRDMLISGTVGAAQQAYSRDINAIAISVAALIDVPYEPSAFVLRAIVESLMESEGTYRRDLIELGPWLMNVNLPKKSLDQLEGVQVTKVGKALYLDQVEESDDVRSRYFWITRSRPNEVEPEETTDIAAIRKNRVSINLLEAGNLEMRMTIYLERDRESCLYILANHVQETIKDELRSSESQGSNPVAKNDMWESNSVTPPWLNERTRAIKTLRGNHARILCRNLHKTIEFYRKLGFTESNKSEKQRRNSSAVVLERDGFSLECRLMRHWRLQGKNATGDRKLEATRVVFRVMSLEALHDTFEKAGIDVSSGIEKNYGDSTMEFEVEDPDGNIIIFVQGMFAAHQTNEIGKDFENKRLYEVLRPKAKLHWPPTTRAVVALDRGGIEYVGQLLDMSPHDILQVPGIGEDHYLNLWELIANSEQWAEPWTIIAAPMNGKLPLRRYLQPRKMG